MLATPGPGAPMITCGRPVMRATNTGISTFIAADGTLSGTVPQFAAQSMTASVVPRRGLTPYARFGNGPLLVLLLSLVAGSAWRSRTSPDDQSAN